MSTTSTAAPAPTPSSSLVTNLRRELMAHAPFSQMAPAQVDRFVEHARLHYYAPGEVVLGPDAAVTGGYPVVALVDEASRDALARAPAGTELRFSLAP